MEAQFLVPSVTGTEAVEAVDIPYNSPSGVLESLQDVVFLAV